MATKRMQWVPIEGTRWRNEVTDGRENHAVNPRYNEPDTLMPDTNKTGTTLIEEGALWPESLPFESEPWTYFFMADEIIRELRKVSGKKSGYASEGNMAHSDEVIGHCDHPRNLGSLLKDDPRRDSGLLGTPECGHMMKLQMKINSEAQVIEEAEIKTFGYDSAIASSSLATERVKGKTSRKHWPSRTRVSPASSAVPRATLLDATRSSRIGRRLHVVGSPAF